MKNMVSAIFDQIGAFKGELEVKTLLKPGSHRSSTIPSLHFDET